MMNVVSTSRSIFGGYIAVFVLITGCFSQSGVDRQFLSGKVTFDGQPLPAGEIQFRPDFDKGNKGPGTYAKIVDGRFQTPDSKGVVPGPTVVTVSGFDGIPYEYQDGGETIVEKRGRPVFSKYRIDLEIPAGVNEIDLEIPGSASSTIKGKK
jgi:hypothetical protein